MNKSSTDTCQSVNMCCGKEIIHSHVYLTCTQAQSVHGTSLFYYPSIQVTRVLSSLSLQLLSLILIGLYHVTCFYLSRSAQGTSLISIHGTAINLQILCPPKQTYDHFRRGGGGELGKGGRGGRCRLLYPSSHSSQRRIGKKMEEEAVESPWLARLECTMYFDLPSSRSSAHAQRLRTEHQVYLPALGQVPTLLLAFRTPPSGGAACSSNFPSFALCVCRRRLLPCYRHQVFNVSLLSCTKDLFQNCGCGLFK